MKIMNRWFHCISFVDSDNEKRSQTKLSYPLHCAYIRYVTIEGHNLDIRSILYRFRTAIVFKIIGKELRTLHIAK